MGLLVVSVVALLAVLAVRAHADVRDEEPFDRDPLGADERDARHRPRTDVLGPRTDVLGPRADVAVDVRGAPPIAAVVAAAYRAAGLADDPLGSWRLRSRLSALLPSVSVRAGQNDHWRDVIDPTISRGVAFDVRAAWHIDRLLFDSNEPRFEMIDVARRRERRRLATLVVHRYFDWLAARNAAAVIDAAECAAELDALTDGWFSQATGKAAQP